MPERPRFSRFRRLPGLFRTGDAKPPDPSDEPVPVTVYLPARLVDLAQNLAARHGVPTVQEYCEDLLKMALQGEEENAKQESIQVTRGSFESLDELTNDPDYLSAWTASVREQPDEPVRIIEADDGRRIPDLSPARDIIFRHTGLGENADYGLLPALRRGEVITEELEADLINALIKLETILRAESAIDRKLAYALHRLAFEGQILVTESASEAAYDPSTIERLRRIQESVDRVLSGDDIRYYDVSARTND